MDTKEITRMLTKTSKLLSVITAVVIVMSSALTAVAAPQLIEGDGKDSLIIGANTSKADGDKSIAIGCRFVKHLLQRA